MINGSVIVYVIEIITLVLTVAKLKDNLTAHTYMAEPRRALDGAWTML